MKRSELAKLTLLTGILLVIAAVVTNSTGTTSKSNNSSWPVFISPKSAEAITKAAVGGRTKLDLVYLERRSALRKQVLATPVLKPAQLDSAIQANMLQYHVRGVSVCAIMGDSVVWEGNYGFGDSAGTKPITDSTLFELASISKTFIANAVLQLWENGLINLDSNVNKYLPFPVRNCYFPDSAITPRMLLAHVSSIARNDLDWDSCPGMDCPTPLTSYLQDYLVPGGSRYKCTNYLNAHPGDSGVYCNWAFAVLGVLIEQVSGKSFEQYFQDSLFLPLGMTNTSWFLANLDTADIAMPLWWNTATSKYQSFGHYGIPIYPCGQLRTSSRHLAKHLSAFLGYGEVGGARILDSLTVEDMQITQYPNAPLYPWIKWGLGWFQVPSYAGGWMFGHDGSLWGIATIMLGSVTERAGYVMLANADWNDGLGNNIVPLIEVFSRDTDQDGVIAGLDNCYQVHNPGQADSDHDGIGNACCCVSERGNVNYTGIVDLADLSALVSYLTGGGYVLPCPNEANVNGVGIVDLADLSALVSYLTGGGYVLPICA